MLHSKTDDSNQYLKQGALLTIISVTAGFTADYLFNLTLSRSLAPHEYGDYKVAYAFAALAGVLVLLGGDRVAPRILAMPLSRHDNRPVWEYLRFYLLLACGLSVLVFITTATLGYVHLGTADPQHHHPLVMMSLVIPLIAVGALLSRILQAARHLALSNLPWRIALPLLKAVLILVMMYSLAQVELWQVIASGALVAASIAWWQWRRICRLGLIRIERFPDRFDGKETLKLSIPMMLTMLVTLALNQIDLFMLEMLATEHDVGYFAAASTTAHILPVAQVTIVGLFLPLIQPAMEQGPEHARPLFWQGQRLIMAVVGVLAVLLILAGSWFLSFFGRDYRIAETALVWLVLAQTSWAMVALSSTWLQYASRGHWVLWAGLVALVLDMLCNIWLIPIHGINGAAMATLISLSCAALMVVGLFWRYQRSR